MYCFQCCIIVCFYPKNLFCVDGIVESKFLMSPHKFLYQMTEIAKKKNVGIFLCLTPSKPFGSLTI